MKSIFALLVLFSVALSQQQVQAQEVQSYEEWRKSLAKGSKTATKPAKVTKAKAPTKAAVNPEQKAEVKPTAPAMAAPAGTFYGTLPCADCQGISTELELNSGGNSAGRTFKMKQTYLGKPSGKNTVTSSGKWFLARGNKQNPDAVVLQLIPVEGNIDPMYFLQVSATEVKLLNRQQEEIIGQHNYNLTTR